MLHLNDSAKTRLSMFICEHTGRIPEPRELCAFIDALDDTWSDDLKSAHMELSKHLTKSGNPEIFQIDGDDLEFNPQ